MAPGHHGYERAVELISGQASSWAIRVTSVRARRLDRYSISSFTLADLGGTFGFDSHCCGSTISFTSFLPSLSSCHFPCSIWRPFPRPDLHAGEGSARRAGQGWPSRWPRHSLSGGRPRLDGPEHDARLKRGGAQHPRSSSSRSHDPWRAPPRRCAPVCWRVRSPARCGAGVFARSRSTV